MKKEFDKCVFCPSQDIRIMANADEDIPNQYMCNTCMGEWGGNIYVIDDRNDDGDGSIIEINEDGFKITTYAENGYVEQNAFISWETIEEFRKKILE